MVDVKEVEEVEAAATELNGPQEYPSSALGLKKIITSLRSHIPSERWRDHILLFIWIRYMPDNAFSIGTWCRKLGDVCEISRSKT